MLSSKLIGEKTSGSPNGLSIDTIQLIVEPVLIIEILTFLKQGFLMIFKKLESIAIILFSFETY